MLKYVISIITVNLLKRRKSSHKIRKKKLSFFFLNYTNVSNTLEKKIIIRKRIHAHIYIVWYLKNVDKLDLELPILAEDVSEIVIQCIIQDSVNGNKMALRVMVIDMGIANVRKASMILLAFQNAHRIQKPYIAL